MSVEEKVNAVEEVFRNLDRSIELFQSKSSLHCLPGCGKCCFKPDIEATVLEFLPFALHLYKESKAEEWLEKLNSSNSEICMILNPLQGSVGLCSQYPYRGLICRLFGFSARTNKYGRKELVTCEVIKTDQPDAFRATDQKINGEFEVPVMSDYYMRIRSIDPVLGTEFYPINLAIQKAIETVLQYFAYR